MRTRAIAARDEWRVGRRDLAQRADDVLVAGDVRGIALGPDDHEIVVHDVEALHALSFGHELVLGRTVMNEHDIGVTPPADVERLAGTDGDDLDADALHLRELRKQMIKQAGLLRGGRRGDRDSALLCARASNGADEGKEDRCKFHRNTHYVRGASPKPRWSLGGSRPRVCGREPGDADGT